MKTPGQIPFGLVATWVGTAIALALLAAGCAGGIDTGTPATIGTATLPDEGERVVPMPPVDLSVTAHSLTLGTNTSVASMPASGCPVFVERPSRSTQINADTALGLEYYRRLRKAMGIDECAVQMFQLEDAAWWHAHYIARHAPSHPSCFPDGSLHSESAACTFFHGTQHWDRINTAGGFPGTNFQLGRGEVVRGSINSGHTVREAVDKWMSLVWHQLPFMDNRGLYFGYGRHIEPGLFDNGGSTAVWARKLTGEAAHALTVWPSWGQTNVPRTADAREEEPTPPAPPGGWPSSYPVTLHAPNFQATSAWLQNVGPNGNSPPVVVTGVLINQANDTNHLMNEHEQAFYGPALPANTWFWAMFEGRNNGATTGPLTTHYWAFKTGAI